MERKEKPSHYFVSTLTIKGHLIYLASMEKNKRSTRGLHKSI